MPSPSETQETVLRPDLHHDQLLRRVFTLAIAEPLYKLCPDAKKAPLDKLDYFSIAMNIIEAVLKSLHLGSMAGHLRREDLAEQIASWMTQQLEVLSHQDEIEQLPSNDTIYKQADEIIDRLLNNKAAACFSTRIFSYPENAFKTLAFFLLEEWEGEARQFYLKPSTECANLYFNALSQSLEDKQIAIQAVLNHQLTAGKFEEAGKTADEHRGATYQHRNELRNLLQRIRTNVRNLEWQTQVQPQIDSALHSIKTFLKMDERILHYIRDDLTEKQSPLLADIIVSLQDCYRIYTELYQEANNLAPEFLEAQLYQCFFDADYGNLPNLREDILTPLLKAPQSCLPAILAQLEPIVTGPLAEALPDLLTVVRSALAPIRTPEEMAFAEENRELEEIIPDPPFVNESDVEQARHLMQMAMQEGECTLHELLEQVATEHNALPLSKALAALAHGQYAQVDDATAWLTAVKTGIRFESAHCSGDNILLRPQQEKETRRA